MIEPHAVTVKFGAYGPTYTMTCHGLHDAPCRAKFACACDQWHDQGRTETGIPWHSDDPEYGDTERCYGEFDPDWCNVTEWFNEADGSEELAGSVTFRVKYAWEGEFFRYEVAGEPSE